MKFKKIEPLETGNEIVAKCGRSAALDAVEKATGQDFLSEVPDDKIAATARALHAAARPNPRVTFSEMAAAIYAKR